LLRRAEDNGETSSLTKLEYEILKAVRITPKTEKKISRQIGINPSILSPVITGLMLRGYIQSTTKRRILMRYSEYFSITVEGLAAFEANAFLFHPLTRAISHLKDLLNARILSHEDGWTFVTMGLSVVKITYRLAIAVLEK
jgi:DNA-binding MarR family transcriptional regulator